MSRFSPGIISAVGGGGGPPFNYSGQFTATLDGWSAQNAFATWFDEGGRTNPGCVYMSNSGAIVYTIADPGGLSVTVTMWSKTVNTLVGSRFLEYSIDGAAYVSLVTLSTPNVSYQQMQGVIPSEAGKSLAIRARFTSNGFNNGYFDDWSIVGA